MRPRLLLTINWKFSVDFFVRGLRTRTAVARLPLRQHRLSCILQRYHPLRHRYRSITVNAVPNPAITAVTVIKSNPITAVAVSSPSGVWGGAPAEIEFGAF